MNNMRYIIYARKSSESKERQVASIGDQLTESQKYAERQGLKIVEVITESHSAFKPKKRPEFDRMMKMIDDKQIDGVVTWKLDRISRNHAEGGHVIQLLQDGDLKEIHSVADNTIYTVNSDHLILLFHLGLANQFSKNLSQNVRRGMNSKCLRHEYPRPAPLGYEGFGDKGKRNIKPHQFEAPIIRELFTKALEGNVSLNALVQLAKAKGLTTRKGKTISKSHMATILSNKIYCGFFTYGGETFRGSYDPIVTPTLFDKVQVILKNRSKSKLNEWKHIYNGLIKCGECGCAVTTTVKQKYYRVTGRKGIYTYHHCTHRKTDIVCDQPPVKADELDEQLIEQASRIVLNDEVWQLGIELLKAKYHDESTQSISRLSHYQSQIKETEEKLHRLVEMRADGELTRDEFFVEKNMILKDQGRLESLMQDNQASAHSWLDATAEYLDVAHYARDVMRYGLPEEKKDLILTIGENLTLRDKKLDFQFRKPYDVLLLPEYRTNGLPD